MPTATPEQNSAAAETVIDLLDRQPFITQMLQIAETLSKNKKNACYALNGAWGVGKSFVINEFEKKIAEYGQDGTTLNRFLLFHYDCWKYDYYAEPLIAIISAMLETIERDVQLLSENTKKSIMSTLKAIGIYALDHFDKRIERKLGFSPKEIYDAIVNTESEILSKIEESHEFDSYYAIKATLNRLRESIANLAEDQTILLVVDELDRCLPEYTIKVLERLHHVFEGIPNVQIILATDKTQLGHVVRQIYGDETCVEKYLEKFIQFELSLQTGTVNDAFHQRFASYSGRFESLINGISLADVDEFRELIFDGVDIRIQISLIERCRLIHNLLVEEHEKMDISIMCIELFLSVMRYYDLHNSNNDFHIGPDFSLPTSFQSRNVPPNIDGLKRIAGIFGKYRKDFFDENTNRVGINFYSGHPLIYSFILGIYRRAYQTKNSCYFNDCWFNDHQQMYNYIVFTDTFYSMLDLIH